MNLAGWELDLPALYGRWWQKRARFHLSERLFEAPGADWALVLFAIGEIGMNKQVGRLALLRGKDSPRVVRRYGRALFWFEGQPGEPVVFIDGDRRARLLECTRSFWRREPAGLRERFIDGETGRLH